MSQSADWNWFYHAHLSFWISSISLYSYKMYPSPYSKILQYPPKRYTLSSPSLNYHNWTISSSTIISKFFLSVPFSSALHNRYSSSLGLEHW